MDYRLFEFRGNKFLQIWTPDFAIRNRFSLIYIKFASDVSHTVLVYDRGFDIVLFILRTHYTNHPHEFSITT